MDSRKVEGWIVTHHGDEVQPPKKSYVNTTVAVLCAVLALIWVLFSKCAATSLGDWFVYFPALIIVGLLADEHNYKRSLDDES